MIVASASQLDVLGWGAVGALFSAVIALVIPAGIALARGKQQLVIDTSRVVGFFIVTACYAGVGGLVALKIGHAKNSDDAFFYGVTWETVVAGGLKSGKALL